MRRQTIKEALSNKDELQPEDYRLYIIRDGEIVFYVGQAANTYSRLLSHLGMDWHADRSPIGASIYENAPASDDWLFEEYTLEDCRDAVIAYNLTLPERLQAFLATRGNPYDVTKAEMALIALYKPCFNVAGNPNPSPLPVHYKSSYHRREPYENPYGDQMEADFGIEA